MTSYVLLPKIEVYITHTDVVDVYTLLVDGEYECTYSSETDLLRRIEFITQNALRGNKNEDSIK